MKPANIPSLHDKIFRQFMSHPEIAQCQATVTSCVDAHGLWPTRTGEGHN